MTEDSTRRFVEASLKRANEALEAAMLLLENGEFRDAVSRAYYAMFHAARALLNQRGITAKTHAGIQLMFDTHIVKGNILSREYGEMFRRVFNLRQKCDYEVYAVPKRNEAEDAVAKAGKFIRKIEELTKQA
ncbi:MAG: HEPN domain-containing protein [Candidatus Bathyarchaeales archaeon]